ASCVCFGAEGGSNGKCGLRRGLVSLIEAVGESSAIDVEGLEYLANLGHTYAPIEGPEDDIEVFLSGFEAIENSIEEKCLVLEASLEEAEVTAVQLDPEARSLQVFHPPGPQVAPPVHLHPAANGGFSQVASCFLALNPFIDLGFFFAFSVNAAFF